METEQKRWNRRQKVLRQLLSKPEQHQDSIGFFLEQHGMLHAPEVTPVEHWSYEEELLRDLDEAQMRRIPPAAEHSIAWLIWHVARIEDVAMNLLVAGTAQLLHKDGWLKRLGITVRDTGNLMGEDGVGELSSTIDIEAVKAYRQAVGRRTREIAKALRPEQLKQKVEPSRLQRVAAEGAVIEAASDLIDYWSKRTIAGLLLMPPTRHNFVHLNEASRLKKKLQ